MRRFLGRIAAAFGLLAVALAIAAIPDFALHLQIPPVGGPRGPVRILRFYATTATIALGDKAQLCYGVENAKVVRITPPVEVVAPVANGCLEIVPDHTTHYTILAVGFDGKFDHRSITLVVENGPSTVPVRLNVAGSTGVGAEWAAIPRG